MTDWGDFEMDAVIVVRNTPSLVTVGSFALVTVYSGPMDVQEGGGSMYYNPKGVAVQSDADAFLGASTAAALPKIQEGDIVQVTSGTTSGKDYIVVSTSIEAFAFPHLELKLKAGPLSYKGAK